jgi:hypothetical protein
MSRAVVTTTATKVTANGAVIHAQPFTATPGMIMLASHKTNALNRKEPRPKVMKRKRLVNRNRRGQSRKIRSKVKNVNNNADRRLLM